MYVCSTTIKRKCLQVFVECTYGQRNHKRINPLNILKKEDSVPCECICFPARLYSTATCYYHCTADASKKKKEK